MNDNLLELLIKSGYAADYASSGEEIVLECPLCADHKRRLYVSRRDYLWICHNCGEKGNVYSFLERVLHFDPIKAGHIAKNLLGHSKKREHIESEREDAVLSEEEVAWPPGYIPLRNPDDILEKAFWRYLRRRGISDEDILGQQMGYVLGGPYVYRAILPVYRNGKRMGWLARDITGEAQRKVLTAPGMKTSQVVYNLDRVRGKRMVGLVEGAFDALTLPQFLVASLGAKLSPIQRRLLREAGVSCVIMLWDSDEAGIAGMQKTIPQLLGAGFEVELAILPPGDDPNSAGPDKVIEALDQATPVTMSARHQIRRLVETKLNSIKESSKEKQSE